MTEPLTVSELNNLASAGGWGWPVSLVDKNDPVLHTRANEVSEDDIPHIRAVLPRMWKLLEEKNGVGLAAPQVGIARRFFLTSYGGRVGVHLNPEIIKVDPQTEVDYEGCLSFPGTRVKVTRHTRIKVRYDDLDGKTHKHYMNGMMARIFQHELDHVDGIVHIDRALEQGYL